MSPCNYSQWSWSSPPVRTLVSITAGRVQMSTTMSITTAGRVIISKVNEKLIEKLFSKPICCFGIWSNVWFNNHREIRFWQKVSSYLDWRFWSHVMEVWRRNIKFQIKITSYLKSFRTWSKSQIISFSKRIHSRPCLFTSFSL